MRYERTLGDRAPSWAHSHPQGDRRQAASTDESSPTDRCLPWRRCRRSRLPLPGLLSRTREDGPSVVGMLARIPRMALCTKSLTASTLRPIRRAISKLELFSVAQPKSEPL